eukprot:12296817-Alexandrium_andersonii.AAC.1
MDNMPDGLPQLNRQSVDTCCLAPGLGVEAGEHTMRVKDLINLNAEVWQLLVGWVTKGGDACADVPQFLDGPAKLVCPVLCPPTSDGIS